MATVLPDILEQPPRATWDRQGFVCVRTFKIDGISNATPTYTVLNALSVSGIPQRGDAYPSTTSTGVTLRCDTVEAEALSPTQIQVICTYRITSAVTAEPVTIAAYPGTTAQTAANTPLISCGSTVQQAETAGDNNGNLMTVSYVAGSSPSGTTSVIAAIQIPNTVLRLTRRETAAPIANSINYPGCVNSATFYGAAIGTMLCTRLEGNTNDDGYSWIVEYEFQYNPDTWQFGAWYTDLNGKIPADATSSNGFGTFDIYPSLNFNNLALG